MTASTLLTKDYEKKMTAKIKENSRKREESSVSNPQFTVCCFLLKFILGQNFLNFPLLIAIPINNESEACSSLMSLSPRNGSKLPNQKKSSWQFVTRDFPEVSYVFSIINWRKLLIRRKTLPKRGIIEKLINKRDS